MFSPGDQAWALNVEACQVLAVGQVRLLGEEESLSVAGIVHTLVRIFAFKELRQLRLGVAAAIVAVKVTANTAASWCG